MILLQLYQKSELYIYLSVNTKLYIPPFHMREFILRIINYVIRKLQIIRTRVEKPINTSNSYSSLSPINTGSTESSYHKALIWALTDKKGKDIRNIALTGPYGSGKSTILKTFQENYIKGDLHFLNISLATFKEEHTDGYSKEDIQKNKVELLKQIETSILEQIFYHEEDSKVPDSRFKKIKSYSKGELLVYSFWYLLMLFSASILLYPKFLSEVFIGISFSSYANYVIHYSSVIILFVGVVLIIYKSSRLINSLAFNKLSVQNIEIGVGENVNKSILNHHIDEILYFFSVRPYNVVIIEDLDRFRETEIFTKLREINLLLNNSERTKKKEIIFIYAIRDEMFSDKERTKFFDFIIPVIPIINSSNSSEMIKKSTQNNRYKISESLIEQVSYFIDDMRLLHNINNEYTIYRENLDTNLNQDKLFAILVYKNIYPKDFVSLTYNEGFLFELISSKRMYMTKLYNQINEKNEIYLEQISILEDVHIESIRDLRYIYSEPD